MFKLENIHFSYNKKPVLKGVSFSVKKYKLTGIIGPNGAGKSTLLKIMLGILKPLKGEIFLAEKRIQNYKIREIASIVSYVSQEPGFFLNLPCGYVVASGRNPYLRPGERYKKEDYEIAKEKMKMLGIEELFNKNILEISSGERRLVVIARALAQDTPVLLLDEPTNHLDLYHRVFILQLLKDLSKNKTILFVSHSINDVLLYCDEVMVIDKGRIVKKGHPEEVINKELLKNVWGVKVDFIEHPVKRKKQIIVCGL